MISVIHHNDLDGRCAAAVVRFFDKAAQQDEISFTETTYENDLDVSRFASSRVVYVVDFSFDNVDDWERLIKSAPQVVWIDHHVSAIAKKGPQQQLNGLRSTTSGSAALLTYTFLTGESDVSPRVLKLVSDFDTWNWAKTNDQEPVNFMYGMKGENDLPDSRLWDDLLAPLRSRGSADELINRITETGKKVHAAYDKDNAEFIGQYGFTAELDGYRVVAANRGKQGSLIFGKLQDQFDITSTFAYDACKDIWLVSLYSKNPKVDVSAIAQRFGGGGHRGASGFTCKELPFKNRRALND